MLRFTLLFTFLSTMLFAQQENEQFPFIGATLATHSIDLKSTTSSQNETIAGFRYGKQTLDWRTVFTLTGNNDLQTFAMEIDKILLDELFGTPKLRPYLGATVGYLHYEESDLLDNDGFFFGGNFGFLIYATATIDVDLSYHYYKVSAMDPLDTMQGANLSLHYFF
ncbi:hypothetical protein MN086_03085 [Sulfurovum sp. XGS-02]|uniref:hypothetical protein n=1 Tax=Sulfurovum sp. XGS-02 TaxID=2925411 RepID=UPI00204E7244|nr:hypothetical protein [Sulfurovum sp. XGS-02]UPT78138.1 hypothetical protein MN086_03085 [Sulfurovum sp. XGS-02]